MIDRVSTDEDCSRETEILLSHLRLKRKIGYGGFGYVYEGTYRGTKVAVKKMHSNRRNRMLVLESLRAELFVVRMNLSHPNIVRTLGTTSSGPEVDDLPFLVMEFAGRRNLQCVINNTEEEIISPCRRTKYAAQVCRALEYTHSKGIVHLDVKPANVIVDDSDTCKLGDFGCAQRLGDSGNEFTASPSITGTTVYRAPELLRGFCPQTSADIYSVGVLCWTLLTREVPYGAENLQVITWGVVMLNLRPDSHNLAREDQGEAEYQELYKDCWEAEPTSRPTASEFLERLQNIAP
uniref:non-specific serine/threonine protein kinase n=1 Tax=Pleurobrachia pileus TaxID=140457 RepID=C0J9J0_PLEPI|nr:protein kinase Mos [Pleurobrachia pileus]